MLVHTGQHYDDALSQVFFDELELPRPEHRLDLGGGTNTEQTARMLAALGPLIAHERPAIVLVYGDTNSTLAGALAAAQAGVPVAHVEAGMRSYDRTMPEELNRVLTDHASDLLLCSSEAPAAILRGERVAGEIEVVGDVMVDVAQLLGPRAAARTAALEAAGVTPGGYVLATAHRAGNVDDPARLAALVGAARAPCPGRSSCRCTRAPPRGSTRRACATRSAASGSPRRSATSTSPRCCATPVRCSRTRAASRRRPTWPACPA